MKAVNKLKTARMALILALISAAPLANATVPATKQDIVNRIVLSVVERPRVLIGITNAERALGSTAFSLRMLHLKQRVELRAALGVNQQGAIDDLGPSSNPGAYHLDVSYLTAPADLAGPALRLNYRKSLTHTTPVGTRILTYDAPINSSLGNGRLVATVQQRAISGQQAWKTTATLLQFVSK